MKLKRCLPIAAVILILSTASFANSASHFMKSHPLNDQIYWLNLSSMDNSGGTMTYNAVSQTLTMSSVLTTVNFPAAIFSGDLGTVTLTTGALTSGNIYSSAVFGGGTFTIASNGTDGLPDGVIFSGTFTSVTWREIGHTDQYLFIANGLLGYCPPANKGFYGIMIQTSTLVSGTAQFNVNQGRTVVPEPSSWAMLGMGLCGIAGLVRTRLRSTV
jgi:hypothetical protein